MTGLRYQTREQLRINVLVSENEISNLVRVINGLPENVNEEVRKRIEKDLLLKKLKLIQYRKKLKLYGQLFKD